MLPSRASRKCAPATPKHTPWHRVGLRCTTGHAAEDDEEGLEHFANVDLDEDAAEDIGFQLSYTPFMWAEDGEQPDASLARTLLRMKQILGRNEYLIVWEDPDGTWQSEGSTDNPPYQERLMEVLAGGGAGTELLRSKFHQFTVRATENFSEWTPIGRDTGALWTKAKFEAMAAETDDPTIGLMATDIPKELFSPLIGRVSDLVQEATSHGNEFRFLQDPAWHKHGGLEKETVPNVGAFAVITRKAPHLQVVYFAMCDIKAGDELTIGWGDAPWDELLNLRLVEYAQIAHSHHVHLKFLEALLLKHSLTAPPAPPLPCNKGGVYLSTLDPASDIAIAPIANATDGAARVLQAIKDGETISAKEVAKRTSFERIPNPFQLTGVEELHEVDPLDLPEDIRKYLKGCYLSDSDEWHWEQPYADLLGLIVCGAAGCDAYIAIAKDTSKLSPVALFTPPSVTPYAAVAKAHIRKGWPIVQYAGRLVLENNVESDNHYLYELSREEMASRGYKGPPLLLDPEKRGGPARWINDDWTPRGLPKRQPNCYVELVFSAETQLPHLIWFAAKDIKKGQELIGSYGPRYWRHVFKDLLKALTDDTLRMRHKSHHIMDWLKRNHPQLVPPSNGAAKGTQAGTSSNALPPPKRARAEVKRGAV